MSPLMIAAANGHEDVVDELLSAGADVNYTETVSLKPFMMMMMVIMSDDYHTVCPCVMLCVGCRLDSTHDCSRGGPPAHGTGSPRERR